MLGTALDLAVEPAYGVHVSLAVAGMYPVQHPEGAFHFSDVVLHRDAENTCQPARAFEHRASGFVPYPVPVMRDRLELALGLGAQIAGLGKPVECSFRMACRAAGHGSCA